MFSLLPFYCFSGIPARKMASSTLIKEGSVCTPAVPHVTSLSTGTAKDAPAQINANLIPDHTLSSVRANLQRFGHCLRARCSAPRLVPGILTYLTAESGSQIAGGCASTWREVGVHLKHFLCPWQYLLPINRPRCLEGREFWGCWWKTGPTLKFLGKLNLALNEYG